MKTADCLIVGAGFAGAVCARVLADAGKSVILIDRRPHIGGNAHDVHDAQGVLVHPYGPHIFHTNAKRVFEFLSRFTTWRFYEHRVLARVRGQFVPIPINRTTINALYGLGLTDDAAVEAFYASVREPRAEVRTSEDVVISAVGRELCDLFFRGYTRKQWGRDLSELGPSVAARIPTRTNDDDRYFGDNFQFMPAEGFTVMFQRMLEHPGITVETGVDFSPMSPPVAATHTIYTGPIDAFFDHRFGPLPYRSLRFEHLHLPDTAQFQPVGTVNYPNDEAFTRITEFRHLTGQVHRGTSIVREYSQAEGDPYYPIPNKDTELLYQQYKTLADALPNVSFVGRLAQYRYYNMDQVVGAALTAAANVLRGLS
jgi:UDP-galactopyranose mutase